MSVQILHDRFHERAVLTCNTTDQAFGPVFLAADGREADERAEAFLRWVVGDVRLMDDGEMASAYSHWLAQEETQIARERLVVLEKDAADDLLLDHEVPELAALRARADLR